MSQPLTRSGVRQWSTGVWFPIALRVELVQKGVSGRGGSCLSPLYFTSSSDMVIFRPWWTNKCLLLLEYQIGTGFQAGLIQWIVFLKCMDHKKKTSDMFFHSSKLEYTAVYLSPNLGFEEMKKCLRMHWGVSNIFSQDLPRVFFPHSGGTAFRGVYLPLYHPFTVYPF